MSATTGVPMILAEALTARMLGEMRSRRYRPLPPLVPLVLGEPDPVPHPVPVSRIDEREAMRERLAVARARVRDRAGADITMADIIRAVASAFETTRAEMLGSARTQWHSRPRQAAYMLARELTDLSLPTIAKGMCKADHSAIITGLRRARMLMDIDPSWRERYLRAAAALHPDAQRTRDGKGVGA